jgi:hypothetical protein
MNNLLKETLEELEAKGKKESDVKWVGTSTHKTTWEDFKRIADVEYKAGYGVPVVAQDLLIVGENWWLERGKYDGSEWWNYKELPKEPTEIIELKALTVNQADDLGYDVSCGWENLLSINGISWWDDLGKVN